MTANEVKAFESDHAKEILRMAEHMHQKLVQPLFDMTLIGVIGCCPIAEDRAVDQFDALTELGAELNLVSGCYTKGKEQQ